MISDDILQIHERWATKISAIDDMIQHLDKAKEQARQLELQEEAKAKEEYAFYQDLGLPSGILDPVFKFLFS